MDHSNSSSKYRKSRRGVPTSLFSGERSETSGGRHQMAKVGVTLATIFVFSALIIYGINVHYSVKLNEVSKASRNLHEYNKELHVKLNRLMSYKNLQTSVEKVPYLIESADRIEVHNLAHPKLPVYRAPKKTYPQVYGY